MYKLMIGADHLIEITSLDSFDQIGTTLFNGGALNESPFLSAIHNVLTYVMSTRKIVVVKCQFGSIAGGYFNSGNEDTNNIVKEITSKITEAGKVTVLVGSHIIGVSSWNHGKIIVLDGERLITGGSNYYTRDYLREDPIHDLSLQVSLGSAITAHRYSRELWRTACDLWSVGGTLHNLVRLSLRQRDGTIELSNLGLNSCPTALTDLVEDGILDDPPSLSIKNKPKMGVRVIVANCFATLGKTIQNGSHTSDIGILAMFDQAKKTTKILQQDNNMLPVEIGKDGGLALNALASSGFTDTGQVSGTASDNI